MSRISETPMERVSSAIGDMPDWLSYLDTGGLGRFIIESRTSINRLEAMNAEATRMFEKARGYEADGATGMVPWKMEHEKLSGGQAAQRVEVARQLEELPRTEEALSRGEIGFEHAVAMAKAATHVGVDEVRKAEAKLLKQAEAMDPGQFLTVTKNFEHQVDAELALAEANRAHERRWFQISAPSNGLVRLEGQVTTEQGAVIRTAIEPFMKPSKNDERTHGQRCADALVEFCRQAPGGRGNSSGPRPQLIIRASLDTLAGITGAPAGEVDGGGTVPAETVQRHACDSAVVRLMGRGELEGELNHATRTLPASTRRSLEARDRHCVWPGCGRPQNWCDGHHLVWWTRGGDSSLANLALLCRPHHRMVHEGRWSIRRTDSEWHAAPPRPSVDRQRIRRE